MSQEVSKVYKTIWNFNEGTKVILFIKTSFVEIPVLKRIDNLIKENHGITSTSLI